MTVHEKHSFRCGWSQKEIKLRQIDTRSEKYKKTNRKVKQASHWHTRSSRNALRHGMPSRAILVAQSHEDSKVTESLCHVVPTVMHKLQTIHKMYDTQCHTPNVNCTIASHTVAHMKKSMPVVLRCISDLNQKSHHTATDNKQCSVVGQSATKYVKL